MPGLTFSEPDARSASEQVPCRPDGETRAERLLGLEAGRGAAAVGSLTVRRVWRAETPAQLKPAPGDEGPLMPTASTNEKHTISPKS